MKSNFKNKKDYMFYENIQDLVQWIKSAPLMGGHAPEDYSTMRETHDSFYGKYTYTEALEKLEHGDYELADKIEKIPEQTMLTQKVMQSFKNDVYGFMPNVPHAIMGLPNSMINIRQHRIKGNNKIIDLVLDADASCGVSSESYAKVAKIFLDVVDALEKQGYRLNLYWALNTDFDRSSSKCCWIMKLKDSTEPFNKYKCAFPLGSVSMFRRIGFRLIETLPSGNGIKDQQSGYGRPGRTPEQMIREGLKLVNIEPKNLCVFSVSDYVGVDSETILKEIKGE
jgi:hypothetical protein